MNGFYQLQESNEFTDAVLDNKSLPLKLENALVAVQIGLWMQEAYNTGLKLYFDEKGNRIDKPQL